MHLYSKSHHFKKGMPQKHLFTIICVYRVDRCDFSRNFVSNVED